MDNIEGGYTIFKFGVGEPVLIDWIHVNNLVQVSNTPNKAIGV